MSTSTENNKGLRKTGKKIMAIFSILIFCSCSYLPIGDETPDTIKIEEGWDYVLYEPLNGYKSTTGLLFYPGGLVDPNAYDVVLANFAEQGYKVVLAKMPLNLAVLNPDASFRIIDRYPEIDKWVIAGHSLGGAMACEAVKKKQESFEGLVLFAAYPGENTDLSSWDGAALSVSASNDLLTTPEEIAEAKVRLPQGIVISNPNELPNSESEVTTLYYEIQGGNHAQFGSYGPQRGDGEAEITPEEQLAEIKSVLTGFWELNKW